MKNIFPLTQTQLGIYLSENNANEGADYNIDLIYYLDSDVDTDRLKQAISHTVNRHPCLKAHIVQSEDGQLFMEQRDDDPVVIQEISVAGKEDALSRVGKKFDLLHENLYRFVIFTLPNGERILYMDFHHILCDGMSCTNFHKEVGEAYESLELKVESLKLKEVGRGELKEESGEREHYEFELAQQEEEERQSDRYQAAKQWYADEFAAAAEVFSMPLGDRDDEQQTPEWVTDFLPIRVEESALKACCARAGVGISIPFTAAMGYTLANYNASEQALFATIWHGRSDKEHFDAMGMFVKTLPVYMRFSDTDTTAMLQALKQQQKNARLHSLYSFAEVCNDLDIHPNVCFAYHANWHMYQLVLNGKAQRDEFIRHHRPGLELILNLIKVGEGDEAYQIKIEYNAHVYSADFIRQFCKSYELVLNGILRELKVESLKLKEESLELKEESLKLKDHSETVVGLFGETARKYPDRVAVIYEDTELTYRELDEQSDLLAAEILKRHTHPRVVAILVERSENMVVCALAAQKAGCAYQPLDPAYPVERLNFMLKDSGAEVLLCAPEMKLKDESLKLKVGSLEFSGERLEVSGVSCPVSGETNHQSPITNHQSPITGDSTFILLYTSGSTGTPKGVQLTHHNLVTFCDWYRRYYALTPEHRVAAYASFGFDADMMDLYPALTTGATVVIVPESLRIDLDALSQYLADKKVTHSFMTTQVGYQFAMAYPTHPTLQHLSVGGEKLASMEPPVSYRFYNAYGPTECTIFSTIYHVTHNERNIPIGRPLDTLRGYVVNRYGKQLPWGAAGELIVCGDQVGKGYLNQEEKTKSVFIRYNGEPAYKTGDIVRYRQNGDIEFVGRQDGQVKIRGFRIELKEVEAVIRAFDGIKDCTVQAYEQDGGGKYIAAYIVSDTKIDIRQLNAFIESQKPAYMVPAITMQIDAIPLNINQKVDKKRLPKPVNDVTSASGSSPVMNEEREMNVLEKRLCEMVEQLTRQTPGLSERLIYCGVNSILAMRLSVMLYKQFGIKVSGKQILDGATVISIENEILGKVMNGESKEVSGVSCLETQTSKHETRNTEHEPEPLSFAQQGVYADCLKNPDTTIYNIPMDICLPADSEIAQLRQAIEQVLTNHPMLFACFTENDEGDIVQSCPASCQPDIAIITDRDVEQVKASFVRPFDLKHDVLHRCAIVQSAESVHVLLDVHHLVADGASYDVILRELLALLRGEKISREDCSYLQFAAEQHAQDERGDMEEHRQFFAEQLSEMEETTSLPADLPASSKGHIHEVAREMSSLEAESLEGVTDASFWFAAIAYTLARYTNSKDVYISTVSNGRQDPAVADTVGMFVNTLPIVAHLREQSVSEYLRTTSHDFHATIQHENYPFSRIAADYGYNADITYAYQLGIIADNKLKGKDVSIQSFGLDTPKFKLGIFIEMYNGKPSLVLQYDDAVYSEARMNRLADSILAVAGYFLADSKQPVRQVSIMTDSQRLEVEQFAHVADAAVAVNTFHEGISRWAQQTPDAVAVIADDATLTYRQYDEAANAMAQRLMDKGVQKGDRIVLLLPRTSDFLVSVLAVMKCGAAFIPMDPEYPADRIAYILSDSQGRYVITTADKMEAYKDRALDIRTLRTVDGQCTMHDVQVGGDDLAYMIYTSGSTGTPKGVMLQHKGICNYLSPHPANPHTYAVATEAKAVLCSATVSFDLSILEYGTALFNGKTVVFANEKATTDSALLAKLYKQTGADVLSGTPSRIETYLEMEEYQEVVKQCKVIQMGGEKLPLSLLKRLQELTKAKIYNMYGPTEITICCNAQLLNDSNEVTVGKPLPNFTEYIVDLDGNPLPAGVMGELIVGGVGVCPGYNNLPDKTKEAFIQWGPNHRRFYRTGDFAKWDDKGDVIILGRTDHQVKLNGLRIELGEIETVMGQQPGVKQCVVQVKKIGKQEKLVAYYVPSESCEADEQQAQTTIKTAMAEHLTYYMVPGIFVRMDRFRTTPAGKIDLKHLPEPQIEPATAYVAPATQAEQDFCDIFAHVLQIEKVGAEDDFFALGGTSLVAIKVVIAAAKKNYEIIYSDVFANPTPKMLAAFVGKDNENANANDNENANDSRDAKLETPVMSNDEFTPLLKKNTLSAFLEGERQALKTVLLTGATGYLGIHVLYRLLTETDVTVYCPIRSKDNTSPVERLRILLFYYFEQTFDEYFDKRLFVIEGEVTQRDWMEQLDIPAKMVINCLANVKHFSTGNDIEFVNVESVRNLVVWCCRSGARLVHISTTSVAGRSINGEPDPKHIYTEQEFNIGQTLDNQYAQAKYNAEKLIFDAILHHNLNAKILRVGNLSARCTDGEFQINFQSNNFMATLRAYQTLGVCPYELLDAPCEFSPIDEVADAVLRLATTPKECVVFHPTNPHRQLIGDVLREIHVLHQDIRPVEHDEFTEIMQKALSDEQLSVKLRPLMAYKQKGNKAPVSIVATNSYTTQVLHRLGFHWSVTSWDYVQKFLQAIAGMGYFES